MRKTSNNAIGIFYERPDGTLVNTYGVRREGIMYYDVQRKYDLVSKDEFQTWKPRRDVTYFPGTLYEDQPLPYVFDLLWDCKTLRHLRKGYGDSSKWKKILEMLMENKIKCDDKGFPLK